MIIIYFFVGIFTAIVSALPLGASNIAVINTTLKQNTKQAFKITITAGLAEVLLSYFALYYNKSIKLFFNNNLWLQILIAIILFAVGCILFFKKPSPKSDKKVKLKQSKYLTGFLLGIINPPVLLYWVVAFGVLNNNDIMLSFQSPILIISLFFFGVYIGKIATLYLYSKISVKIKNKVENIALIINKVTGVLLIIISFIQAIKLTII